MVNKTKKKRNSKDSGSSNAAGAVKKTDEDMKRTDGMNKQKSSSGKSLRFDIFNDIAMENAYYLCHNVQDLLKSRGFAWPESQKKKKKGKR